MFILRNNSFDEIVYNEVFVNNGYHLGKIPGFNVIDVGAHIGCFVKTAIDKGAAFVDAYEMYPLNYKQAFKNTKNYRNSKNARLTNAAVWRSDIDQHEVEASNVLKYSVEEGKKIFNSGGETLLSPPEYDTVIIPTIKFDDILQRNHDEFGSIDLVKMDCEGSEYPILYTSKKLNLIKNMVIEFHHFDFEIRRDYLVCDEALYGGLSLEQYLQDNGFVTYLEPGQNNVGCFQGEIYAMRDDSNNPFLIDYLKGR